MNLTYCEELVVAKLMSDKRAFYDIVKVLQPSDFSDQWLGDLFRQIVKGYGDGVIPDTASLIIAQPDKMDRIFRLQELGSSTTSLDFHIRAVKRGSEQRRLVGKLTEVRAKLASADPTEDQPIQKWLSEIDHTAVDVRLVKGPKKFGDVLNQVMHELENPKNNFVSTGYDTVDVALGGLGLHRGDVWGLAARTGVGKSMVALNMAVRSSLRGHKVLYVTVEMDSCSLVHRAIADLVEVEGRKIRVGMALSSGLKDSDFDKIAKLNGQKYAQLWENLYLCDSTTSIRDVERMVGYERHIKPFDLVVIDYLQLFNAGDERRNVSAFERISAVSTAIKTDIAKKHDVAVISLLQVNREGSKKKQDEIDAFDIRDSNQINQDSDYISVMYHPDMGEFSTEKLAVIRFDKNRHGENNAKVYFTVVGKYLRFEQLKDISRVAHL